MLQKETFDFLKKIKKNNNREWVEKNRIMMDRSKEDFVQFTEKLIREIGKYDEDIAVLEAKKCIFRLNRDVRFSKDKSPYKTAMGAYMNKGGKKLNTAGYYIHAEPGNSFLAGGLWMPDPELLYKVRQEIDYNLKEWNGILKHPAFRKHFPLGPDKSEMLSRPPKGYDVENPALPFLKLRSFTVSLPLSDDEMLGQGIVKKSAVAFKSIKPMLDFLNRALD